MILRNIRIVFTGLSGVPYAGRACDARLTNTVNLLSDECEVIIVNRYSSLQKKSIEGYNLDPRAKIYETIKRRNTGSIISKLLFGLSIIFEFWKILKLNKQKQIDYIHLYTGHYFDMLYTFLISRIIGARVLYEYVEYKSQKGVPKNLYHKINNYLCDYYGAKLWDSCIAISNFLEMKAKEVNPKLPVIKVTPLCNFELFQSNSSKVTIAEKYVMFCGSAGYFEIIKFIIDAFVKSHLSKSTKLLLVLSGSKNQIKQVENYYPNAIIKNRVPYDELISYYKNSYALLIPLRDTIEDKARFPNKISEYTAAKGLIVTTNYGEIPFYFTHGVNAVIANEYDVDNYKLMLDELDCGKYDIEKIRDCCYETGVKHFSINSYKHKLTTFLKDHI